MNKFESDQLKLIQQLKDATEKHDDARGMVSHTYFPYPHTPSCPYCRPHCPGCGRPLPYGAQPWPYFSPRPVWYSTSTAGASF